MPVEHVRSWVSEITRRGDEPILYNQVVAREKAVGIR